MLEKPNHEKLFDEICGKLSELSLRTEAANSEEKINRMQISLQKSQEELKTAQFEIFEKMKSIDQHSVGPHDLTKEIKKISDQLEQERNSSSKLSVDLAKSLELNLKLQFEMEEVRSKMSQSLTEEKKHNNYLAEKNKNLQHEVELTQALCNETKLELLKSKDRITGQQSEMQEHIHQVDQRDNLIQSLKTDLENRLEDINKLSESLEQFEAHSHLQSSALKELSEVAEKKLIELKMALDKKSVECQDYYSHLQQSMSQAAVLRQENSALKDYIAKISQLQQTQPPPIVTNTVKSASF